MTYRVRFRPRARSQALQALSWFQDNAPDQAQRFLDDVDKTAADLAGFPLSHPEHRNGLRRESTAVFRYHLWYSVEGSIVWVMAVIHQSRGPEYLDSRIGRKQG